MVNPLAAALGPVGGLAACACCLIIAAIWGLFATTIALAVYTSENRFASLSEHLSSTGASLRFSRTMERSDSNVLRQRQWSGTTLLQSSSPGCHSLPLWLLGSATGPSLGQLGQKRAFDKLIC